MQINKIIASVLSLFIFLAPVHSKPLAEGKSKTDFNVETMDWAPAPFTLYLGNLEIDANFLMEGVPAPAPGILISREDVNRVEFAMNEAEEWCGKRLQKERDLCDSKLKERDQACKTLTKELLGERDNLLLERKDLKLRLKSEESFSKTIMWVGGAIVLSLAGTLFALQLK